MITFDSIEPTIQCSYLIRSVEFYQLLSFKLHSPLEPEHQSAWLSAGVIWENHSPVSTGITIILNEVYKKISPQQFRIRVSNLEEFYTSCNLSKIPSISPIVHWPHDYSCFEAIDPDGHKITFFRNGMQ